MESGGIALLRRAALATLIASTAYGIGTGRLLRLGMPPEPPPRSLVVCTCNHHAPVDSGEWMVQWRFSEVKVALHRYGRSHQWRLPTDRAVHRAGPSSLCRLLNPYAPNGPLDRPLIPGTGARLAPTLWLDPHAFGKKLSKDGNLPGHFPVAYGRAPKCHTQVLYSDDL